MRERLLPSALKVCPSRPVFFCCIYIPCYISLFLWQPDLSQKFTSISSCQGMSLFAFLFLPVCFFHSISLHTRCCWCACSHWRRPSRSLSYMLNLRRSWFLLTASEKAFFGTQGHHWGTMKGQGLDHRGSDPVPAFTLKARCASLPFATRW